MTDQLRSLTDDLVTEQEEKRKTELDALQSQINPHFLYNTLDSIVWMIEGEQYEDAVFMVTQLASLFRISLSRGQNIIPIEDEIKHAQNYMNIQKVRYKDKFEVSFKIDPQICSCDTVKLVMQPILENAIYHAVEPLDGEGVIDVVGERTEGDIYIRVTDNGLGMSQEAVDKLLTDQMESAQEEISILEREIENGAQGIIFEPICENRMAEYFPAYLYGVGYSEKAIYYLEKGLVTELVMTNEFNLGYLAVQQVASQFGKHTGKNDVVPDLLEVNAQNMYSEEMQKVLFPLVQWEGL